MYQRPLKPYSIGSRAGNSLPVMNGSLSIRNITQAALITETLTTFVHDKNAAYEVIFHTEVL